MRELSSSFFAWCDLADRSYRRPRSAVCHTAAVLTADPDGWPEAAPVSRCRVGEIVDVLETRLVRGRLRARTSAGWLWYKLDDGEMQLSESLVSRAIVS